MITGNGQSVDEQALRMANAGAPVVPQSAPQISRARIMAGAAVCAAAIALPDLSIGAMGVAETRVAVDEVRVELPQTVWTPSAVMIARVGAPRLTSEPENIARVSSPSEFDQEMPVSILESGSERFDLAFAGSLSGVELVRPGLGFSTRDLSDISARRETPQVAMRTARLRTKTIDVPQIADAIRIAPGQLQAGNRLEAKRMLAPPSAPVEAAFAGPLDVSGDVRSALPLPPKPPKSDAVVRAVGVTAPPTSVSDRAEREAVIAPKSKLDARVNGVLTGSVDFEQRDGAIAIRLGSVLNILRSRYSDAEFTRLAGGRAADTFLTLDQLQAAGVPISYSPAYDEIEFGIDYKDAPHAAKVQVEQISASGLSGDSVLIDQIPR